MNFNLKYYCICFVGKQSKFEHSKIKKKQKNSEQLLVARSPTLGISLTLLQIMLWYPAFSNIITVNSFKQPSMRYEVPGVFLGCDGVFRVQKILKEPQSTDVIKHFKCVTYQNIFLFNHGFISSTVDECPINCLYNKPFTSCTLLTSSPPKN